MRRAFGLLASTLLVAAAVAACGTGGTGGNSNTQTNTGTSPPNCVSPPTACDSLNAPCCSGVCNAGSCVAICKGPGESCGSGLECCTGICDGTGKCSVSTCKQTGASCGSGGDCCSTLCSSGTCQSVPVVGGATCKTIGESCASAGDCCSQNCFKASGAATGACARAYTCQANGDLCALDSDCCGNTCVKDATTGVGRCTDPSGGCIQDGNPCALTGGKCCTGLCRDMGSGAAVCVPATGCRVAGDWCTETADCCGGSTTANVQCASNLDLRCDNGQACNPPGATCGAPVLPGGGHISASQDCCDGKKAVCKLDSSGIPRCFGGGSTTCPTGYDPTNPACCIQPGDACEFRDQCCNYLPCVLATPTATKKTCAQVSTCKPLGATCSGLADPSCCTGTSCLASEGGYACQTSGPSCKTNGVACTGASQCCSGICSGGLCASCEANGAACTSGSQCCSQISDGATSKCAQPLACQQLGAACVSAQDCCAGLGCVIPSGALSGTCQSGSTCAGTGQTCSAASPCCQGLQCYRQGTYNPCDGTTACACALTP